MRRRRGRGMARLWTKPVVVAVACAAGLGLLAVAWGAWTAWQVYGDLREAKEEAVILEAALARGDAAGAREASERFAAVSDGAADRTDGVVWDVYELLPIVGDDAEGLATVSSVLSDLAAQALPPMVDSAAELNAGTYAPSDHRFPLEEIAALEEPAAVTSAAFADAAAELRAVDADTFVAPLRREFDALRTEVNDAAGTLDSAERGSRLMPKLLGDDGPRDYLLVFQNNAEIRAIGGLPGVMSLIHAEDGRVEITRQESAGAMGELDRPVLDLPPDEAALYGPQIGTYFLDSNFTPDLPRAAELWRARWRLETGTDIDGVFVVDPVSMSYLLAATGPIQVEGRTLTAENIVLEVEHLAYLRYGDQISQDAFFNGVAKAAFDVFADGRGDQVGMVQGLIRGVTERRILMHSFAPAEQEIVDGTTIAGRLPEEPGERPQVGVYLNDGTGAKMSVFLDHDVQVTSVSCRDGRQKLLGRLRVTSDTPPDVAGLPPTVTGLDDGSGDSVESGHQLVVADLFAPVGGGIGDITFDGERLPAPAFDRYRGRDVVSLGLPLTPDQTRVVTWSMVTGADQSGPTEVSVTPGARPENESSVAPTTC